MIRTLLIWHRLPMEYWSGNPDKDVLRNITYENNIIRFNGYGWGVIRPGINGVALVNAWGHTIDFSHYEKEPNVIFSGDRSKYHGSLRSQI